MLKKEAAEGQEGRDEFVEEHAAGALAGTGSAAASSLVAAAAQPALVTMLAVESSSLASVTVSDGASFQFLGRYRFDQSSRRVELIHTQYRLTAD